MVVHALWRFKASPDVAPLLIALLDDPDVALHAMSALRRSVGPTEALPYLRTAAQKRGGTVDGRAAYREIRKVERAAAALND